MYVLDVHIVKKTQMIGYNIKLNRNILLRVNPYI
jgi:hypothetical protein